MKIVSVEQMRRLEQAAFAQGIGETTLQERAGTAVAEELERRLQPGDAVAILAGAGNNGRDGAVAARWLAQRGRQVDLLLSARHALQADELDLLRSLGVHVGSMSHAERLTTSLRRARLVVDALLGIGARGALREPLATVVRQLNEIATERRDDLQVLALDIPSGIDADEGAVAGEAVRAHTTVTLGAVKAGLLRFPAAAYVGELVEREIGIPAEALAPLPYATLSEEELARLVPARPLDAHKYRFGRVLVLAGSPYYLGAPALCAAGAARAGAGLVTVAAPHTAVRQAVVAWVPEATFVPADLDLEHEPERAVAELEPYLASHPVWVIGPGLGRAPGTLRVVRELLKRRTAHAPESASVVLDADALYALGAWERWWEQIGKGVVLTPHAGELARLRGATAAGTEAPWEEAARLAQSWGCTLVGKGAFSAVAGPDGRADVWGRANPALASAGTGDVLAGICGSLLAQGLQPGEAARLAVGVHALAGASSVARNGWRSLLAHDLLPEIPAHLQRLAQLA